MNSILKFHNFVVYSIFSQMVTKEEHDELCTSYAALILHDADIAITSEKLKELITASGNEVEPYWPMLFAKVLANADVEKLITSCGGGVAATSNGAAAADGEAAAEEEEEEVI